MFVVKTNKGLDILSILESNIIISIYLLSLDKILLASGRYGSISLILISRCGIWKSLDIFIFNVVSNCLLKIKEIKK